MSETDEMDTMARMVDVCVNELLGWTGLHVLVETLSCASDVVFPSNAL